MLVDVKRTAQRCGHNRSRVMRVIRVTDNWLVKKTNRPGHISCTQRCIVFCRSLPWQATHARAVNARNSVNSGSSSGGHAGHGYGTSSTLSNDKCGTPAWTDVHLRACSQQCQHDGSAHRPHRVMANLIIRRSCTMHTPPEGTGERHAEMKTTDTFRTWL